MKKLLILVVTLSLGTIAYADFGFNGNGNTGNPDCPEWAPNCSDHNTIIILPPDSSIIYDEFAQEWVAYCNTPAGINCIGQITFSWVEDNTYMARYVFCRDINENGVCDTNAYLHGGQWIVENRSQHDNPDLSMQLNVRQTGITNDLTGPGSVHPDHIPTVPYGFEECPFGC